MKKEALLLGLAFALALATCGCATRGGSSYSVRIRPSGDRLITGEIQKAIDDCAAHGGGRVVFSAGVFATGGLHLKSNVVQKRNNTLAAFVHFSPVDANPKLESGNWLIRNVTVDSVDHFYVYNHRNGNWQTGLPVAAMRSSCRALASLARKHPCRARLAATSARSGASEPYAGTLSCRCRGMAHL